MSDPPLGCSVPDFLLPLEKVRDRGHRSILLRWFALLAEDIIVTDSQSFTTRDPRPAQAVRITLCGSKANEGGPTYSENVGTLWSPVSILGALLLLWVRGKLPHDIPAAVFTSTDGTPQSCHHKMSRWDQESDDSGATHMYRAGTDSTTIQFHGRLVSDAFKTYTHLCSESVSNLASKMALGSRDDSTLR
ncbi:hypothetical protein PHPALM_31117 [Phytophthora palmivora]|uniref:Uncharacterized protein n=1 Tax=Phytophthora palmivora TaxID=4796 RepID=A0A2P4X3E8_9STRA|nr:hypothetical protein PHPALM_31117 [Phytophthora palmivora]